MNEFSDWESQATIWAYYKPRQTHAWNMLVLSHRALEEFLESDETAFEAEYLWENFIIRLWLYRATILTLTKINVVKSDAEALVLKFDSRFQTDGFNDLKAIRDMIEHFDDYAAGKGRGPATRDGELDPWRAVSRDRFERGRFVVERTVAYDAAIHLRTGAKTVSDAFIAQYNAEIGRAHV